MPTIDERIVEMQFDNKDFEKGVNQSIKSLDSLKKSLQFEDSYDGLDKFAKSINRVDLSGIKNSIDDIGKHFTVVGRFIDSHIDSIIRSVETKLTGVLKSISVDQISKGFGKYETETKAVQTITNATGKSVEEVEQVLGKLMKYTDETSYDFVEMANSIGKFTSVGVELATAEKAMEGIANEAALSGAGKAEANRAMYNFAQALSAGKVQLIDWKSIENANMATKEFKEELIKTAIEYGTLKKTSATAGKIISGSGKKAKETAVNYKTFNQTLSDGWLTSEVLIKTLEKYSEKDGPVGSLGRRAYEAAQKALTFNDAIEAIKDAVSSKWMQSFQYMFGDLNEAIDLWTNFCNAVIEVTDAIGNWRNDLLGGWHEMGGYTAMIETASNVWSVFTSILNAAHDAIANIIPPLTSEKLVEMTERVRDITAQWKNMFGYVEVQDEEVRRTEKEYDELAKKIEKISGEHIIGDRGESVKEVQDILVSLGYLDEKFANGIFGEETKQAVKELQTGLGILTSKGTATGTFDDAVRDALLMGDALKDVDKKVEVITRKAGDMVKTEEEYTEVVNYANKLNTMLEKGRKNNQVKFLQEQLIRLGYLDEGQADGIYGPKTEDAVKRLQKALGVEVTGKWDLATYRAAKASKAFEVTETRVRTIEQTVGAQNKTMQRFQDIMGGATALLDLFGSGLQYVKGVIGVVVKAVSPLTNSFLTIASVVSKCIVSLNKYVKENKVVESALEGVEKFLEPVATAFQNLDDAVQAFFERHQDIATFTDLFKALSDEFWASPIGQKLDEWKNKIDGFLKSIGIDLPSIFKNLKGTFSVFSGFLSDLFTGSLGVKSFDSGWHILSRRLLDSSSPIAKTIGRAMTNIRTTVKPMLDKFKSFWDAVKDSLFGFFGKEEAGGEDKSFLERLKERFSSFSAIGDWFKNNFSSPFKEDGTPNGIYNFLMGVVNVIKKVLGLITQLNVGQIITFALGILAVLKIFKAIKLLLAPFKVAQKLGGMFESVGDFFESITKRSKGNLSTTVLKYAASIAILVGSVTLLASLDPKKAWNAVGIIAALAGVMVAFTTIMNLVNKKGAGNATKGLVKLGVAMLLMAFAVKVIGSLPVESMLAGIFALGLLLTEVGIFEYAMKGNKGVKGVLSIAVSLLLLGLALKNVAKLSWREIGKGLVAIGAILIELGLFLKIADGTKSKTGLFAMVGIGVAVYLLGRSLERLSKLSWKQIGKGLVAIGAILLELVIFTKLVNGSKGIRGTLGMIGVGVAVYLLGKTLENMSKLSWDGILKGLAAIGAVLLEMAIFMKLVSGNKPGRQLVLAVSMIAIGAALLLFARTIKSLSKISGTKLIKAIVALGAVFLEIAIFMKMISGNNPLKMLANAFSMILLGSSLLIFAQAIEQIGSLDSKVLIKGVLGLGAVMLELSMFTKKIAKAKMGLTALPALLVAVTSLLTFAHVLKMVADVPWSTMLAFGVGFGVALNAVSKSMRTLSKVPITGGLAAVANLDIFIANLTLVLTALGGIQELTNGAFGDWLAEGAQALGQAIGGFISGIVDPFRKSIEEDKKTTKKKTITDYLNSLIEDMSAVMDTLEPFLQKVSSFTDDKLTGIKNLVAALALMSGEEILDSIAGWISKGDSGSGFIEFSKSLVAVVPNLKQFSEDAVGIKEENISKAASAISAFGDVAKAVIPLTVAEIIDAVGAFVTGNENSPFVTFAGKLVELLPKVKEFSNESQGIDSNKIETAATALKSFGEVCNAALGVTWTSFLDSIADFITGHDNISGFVDKMITLGPKLKDFGDSVREVDNEAILNSAGSLDALAEVANKIPGADGLVQKIMGEHDIADFGSKLSTLGRGLYGFYLYTQKIPATYNATGYVNALKGLAGVASELPAAGGFIQKIFGENQSIDDFGSRLETLGFGLTKFYNETKDIPASYDASGYVAALKGLAGVGEELPEAGGIIHTIFGENQSIDDFGSKLGTLGEGLYKFYDNTKDIPASYETSGYVRALIALSTVAEKLPAAGGFIQSIFGEQDLGKFGTHLVALGSGLSSFYYSTKNIPKDYDTNGPVKVLDALSELESGLEAHDGLKQWIVGDKSLGEFGTQVKDLGASLKDFNGSTATVDTAKLTEIATALGSLAAAVYQGGNSSFGWSAVQGFQAIFDSLPTLDYTPLYSAGQAISENLGGGLKDSKGSVVEAIAWILDGCYDEADGNKYRFVQIGEYISEGIAEGIRNGAYEAINAAAKVVYDSIAAANEAGEIQSPSRKFAEIGMYMDLGMAHGLEKYSDTVYNSAAGVSDDAIDGARYAMDSISKMAFDDLDDTPVIRPVLDLSDVEAGASMLGSMFGTRTVGLRSSAMVSNIANAATPSNGQVAQEMRALAASLLEQSKSDLLSDVASGVTGIDEKIARLSDLMTNLQVVMETGALVGQIAPAMDRQLGRRASRANRGG